MSPALKRTAALVLSALIAFGAPASAFAGESIKPVTRVAPITGNSVAGSVAASALAPLGNSFTQLGAAMSGPMSRTAFTGPSPWNPKAPTVLIAEPVQLPIQVIGAASMPPVAANEPAKADTPKPAVAPETPVGAASMPPVDGAASKPGAAPGETTTDRSAKIRDRAAEYAAKLKNDPNAELPLPAGTPESLTQASVAVDPNRAYHPSPKSWLTETLYSVFLDRFARSPKAKPVGDAEDGVSRHGGDLRGAISQLDYIKESGVTTIVISPVTVTAPEAYHGYAPMHYLAVDPHLGTMEDFKELVAEAHKRGMRVVLDWVINHSGPVFEYADGKTQWTGDGKPGPVTWTQHPRPVELKEDDYSRKRVITDWSAHDQATQGDFPPNYRHFATDRKETQDKLIQIVQWWMKETDIDGLRLDAVRHVAPGFLPIFSREIRAYAAKLGKKNFLMLGENSTGIDGDIKTHLDDGSLDTLYNYPAFRRENAALHGVAPTRVLEDSARTGKDYLGDGAKSLVRFIDLHDTYRFLLSDTPVELLKTALAFVMLSYGIPMIYNGTEQAYRQLHGRLSPEGGDLPADPQNRADMFEDGKYAPGRPEGPAYDRNAPSYKFLRALADLRKAYPALALGEQYGRWSDPSGPGIYAFSRIHEGQEVLVVMNTSASARSAEMWVDHGITPVGTVLEDALNPGYTAIAHGASGGNKVSVEVPPYGVRVLVRPAPAQ